MGRRTHFDERDGARVGRDVPFKLAADSRDELQGASKSEGGVREQILDRVELTWLRDDTTELAPLLCERQLDADLLRKYKDECVCTLDRLEEIRVRNDVRENLDPRDCRTCQLIDQKSRRKNGSRYLMFSCCSLNCSVSGRPLTCRSQTGEHMLPGRAPHVI